MTTNMQELKAKAFDRLMALMEGEHRLKSTHYVREVVGVPACLGDDPPAAMARATFRDVRVDTYEWRVCVRNSTDIRQVLLDEAAAELKKEWG